MTKITFQAGFPNHSIMPTWRFTNTYEGGQCAFRKLYAESKGTMQEFHRLAEQKAKLAKE